MAGAAGVLIGTCDEILRRPLTLPQNELKWSDSCEECRVSQNTASSSVLPSQARRILISYASPTLNCTRVTK